MKITAIKQQVKRQDRYSIFVDGKYAFSLGGNALLDAQIVIGQELTGEQLNGYQKLSGDDKLFNNALRYAVMRPRSSWELSNYLQRKEADPLLSQQILSRLSNLNFIDDTKFARNWIANRRLLKPISYRRLNLELKQKHVSEEIIQAVLAEDETDEQDTLRQLVIKKRRQSRYQDDQKLMQFLAGQGFGYTDIKAVLSNPEDES